MKIQVRQEVPGGRWYELSQMSDMVRRWKRPSSLFVCFAILFLLLLRPALRQVDEIIEAFQEETVLGPETLADLKDYPYLVHVDYFAEGISFVAALVSDKYAVATPEILNTKIRNHLIVYSEDMASRRNASAHAVTWVYNNGFVAIVKICPGVNNFKPISFNPEKAFDFTKNTEGKLIYFNRKYWTVVYRTVPVLTDFNCERDDKNTSTNQLRLGYRAPKMTCTPYDASSTSCAHLQEDGEINSYPLLLVNNLPVAAYKSVPCHGGRMLGQGQYWKIISQRAIIQELAAVE